MQLMYRFNMYLNDDLGVIHNCNSSSYFVNFIRKFIVNSSRRWKLMLINEVAIAISIFMIVLNHYYNMKLEQSLSANILEQNPNVFNGKWMKRIYLLM